MRFSIFIMGVVLLATSVAQAAPEEYLSDNEYLITFSQQAWGELGIDTCAHAQGQTPLKLQVKDTTYAKGLGHHAPGEIIVDLEGRYDTFEAEVGVQKQDSGQGSVVFQVYVDEEKRFDSGVMREKDSAKPVSLSVKGAQELRLVVTDAGDGMICDCANWANARLVPSASPTPHPSVAERVNIAPFAQVVTCDPARMDGARANRVQEFRAEDMFLETDLAPSAQGIYTVPPETRCIGLTWMERRLLTEAGLQFAGNAPPADGTQVQAWVGQTTHQGEWKPLNGTIQVQGDRWVFPILGKLNPDVGKGVWKIRWILTTSTKPIDEALPAPFPAALAASEALPAPFPAALAASEVRGFSAFSKSMWKTTGLELQLDKPLPGKHGRIDIYNGEIVAGSADWDLGKPLSMQARYSASKRYRYDRTVLRFHLPSDAFGVAVDDILGNGCVYVRDAGLFIKPTDSKLTLAEYKKQIAGRKTVLERVREMPDQTFAQAMSKSRNPIQDNGPTMLSLACDNHKFVMEQDGTVRFAMAPQGVTPVAYQEQVPCALIPQFGGGNLGRAERHVEGGWLPIIVSTWKQGEVAYRERCFVAPYDKADTRLWLNNKPLCVAEFTVENTGSSPADVSLGLSFFSNLQQRAPMELRQTDAGVQAVSEGRLTASVGISGLAANVQGEKLSLTGKLAAGGRAKCFVYLPAWEMKAEESAQLTGGESLVGDVEAYWQRIMAGSMQFEIPEKLLENAIRASEVHCMIAARNEADGARIAAWAAADRYGALESESNSIIRGMDLMGQTEFARLAHDFFIKRFSPEGFLTTGYTLIGTGWQLQTLGQHYDLARDNAWLKTHASDITRVCEWIVKQHKKTMKLDAYGRKVPEYGLIPPGVMADWGNFLPYFCLSGYYYAGLHEAATALADIGYPGADKLLVEAAEFRGDITDAYRRAQARTPVVLLQDGTWVKAYPSEAYHAGPLGDFFPGEDGNRSWCYDVELGAHQMIHQGVLEPNSRPVTEMMDHMEDVQFLAEGWFDYPAEKNHADWFDMGGFSKVQPYYTRNGEIYALTDDVKPFIRSYFNTISAMLCSENLSLWEHFHNAGAWSKTHETGYFLQQSRFMLVMEHGDQLWLAPFVTSNWLRDGMVVAVKDAPTHFGDAGYKITSHVNQGFIEMTIEPPTRSAPKEIVVRLRHPEGKRITSVTVDGKKHARFDAVQSTVTIAGPFGRELSVVARY